MATSRVGGSSGKLSGQVGTTIYQVTKNDKGQYIQIEYNKGVRTETFTSEKLQAQRMCTSMVESLMRDLKKVGQISFQSAKNKTASLNAFSAFNLRLVARDMKENWYGHNQFIFPRHIKTDIGVRDLGGAYIISSGSLSHSLYDREIQRYDAGQYFYDAPTLDWFINGVQFDCQIGVDTLGDLLRSHMMSKLDTVVFCGFRTWNDADVSPDNPTEFARNSYVIATMNLRIPSETVLTRESLKEIFILTSDIDTDIYVAKDGRSFVIGILSDNGGKDQSFEYVASFGISQYTGKKLVSKSTYHSPDGSDTPYWPDMCHSKVFGTWMGEAWNTNYQNPFA